MKGLQNFITLVSCENQKIFRQRKYKILLAITVLLAVGGITITLIPDNSIRFTMANYPYTMMSLISYILAPFVIFLLASDLISGEIASNEIKVLITRPISRYKILSAKMVSIMVYVGIMMGLTFFITSLGSLFIAGVSALSILTAFIAYVVAYIPLLTLVGMACMITNFVKSGTSGFMFCMLLYFGSTVLGIIFSGIAPILFTSYMGIGTMVIGSAIPFANLFQGIVILIGYYILFFSVSQYRFMNREY